MKLCQITCTLTCLRMSSLVVVLPKVIILVFLGINNSPEFLVGAPSSRTGNAKSNSFGSAVPLPMGCGYLVHVPQGIPASIHNLVLLIACTFPDGTLWDAFFGWFSETLKWMKKFVNTRKIFSFYKVLRKCCGTYRIKGRHPCHFKGIFHHLTWSNLFDSIWPCCWKMLSAHPTLFSSCTSCNPEVLILFLYVSPNTPNIQWLD